MSLWMYRARGSGVWYWTGPTMVVSDAVDLAIFLNRTLRSPPHATRSAPGRQHVTKIELMRLAFGIPNIETIIFTHHVDGSARSPAAPPLLTEASCFDAIYLRAITH